MNLMLESMVVAAPAGESTRAAPPPGRAAFRKSSRNPLNMSRTAQSKTTGHAPSARMLLRMQEAATDLATLAATTAGWRFASERNGAMLYELPGRSLPSSVSTVRKFGRGAGHASDFYLVRAVTTVHTGVDALLDLLHSSTTDEFRLVARQIFGEHFHDGVTIDKLTCTTPPPFAPADDYEDVGARRSFSQDDAYSVNWLALKALAKLGGVENHRDFTLVGYQDAFLRRDNGDMERVGRGAASARAAAVAEGLNGQQDGRLGGRVLGVHVLSSVNFEDVPELPLPEATDRLHLRNSGFVVEETQEPNTLRLSLFLSLLPSKQTLRYARRYQRWLQVLASCVGNLAQAVKPEVTVLHMSKLTWKHSDHCFMCVKMFRTFRRCHHCRFCGEAVCGSCSAMVNMAGYEISGGLEASTASAGMSRSMRHSSSNSSMDGFGATANPNAMTNRSSRGNRGPMETRGCHTCIAELQRSLTASAAMGSRAKYGENQNFAASQYEGVVLPSDDDDVISYDSTDDVDLTRLGSVADYTPSDRGTNVVSQAIYNPQKVKETSEPSDDFAMKAEELQDTFPGVDVPPPPRFRNVSDPDQLRRMRNVSDPERLSRFKDKQSTVSMSTASSSFSRTSHDHYLSDNASQYSRGTNFSVMSDASSAGDLSRDPDILALAGLSLKPSSSNSTVPTGEQEVLAKCANNERLADFVAEEPEKEAEAEAQAEAEKQHTQMSFESAKLTTQKLRAKEQEDTFDTNAAPVPWSGSATYSNDSYKNVELRHRSNTASLRRDKDSLHPADVLRHRSNTTAVAWKANALAASAVAAAQTPLPSSSASASTPSESGSTSSYGSAGTTSRTRSATSNTASTNRPALSSSGSGQFHFSRMNTQPNSTTAAIVAAMTAATEATSTPIVPTSSTNIQAPTTSTSSPPRPQPSMKLEPNASMSSSMAFASQPRRRDSAPLPLHPMTSRPLPAMPEDSVEVESNTSDRNDMIPLPATQQATPEFVLFNDSKRESIWTRPDDGNDMIPLDI